MIRPRRPARRGVTPAEVLTCMVVVGVVVLVLLMAMPRQRENARMASCRRNLMQIGLGLALYDRSAGSLPQVPRLGPDTVSAPSPLRAMLGTLELPDFTELSAAPDARAPKRGPVPGEQRVPGFVCPSDSHAIDGGFAAPISYRACAGDTPAGESGGFAPGRVRRLSDVEAGDGRAFTAAFSERMTGDGRDRTPATWNYALMQGPVRAETAGPADPAVWFGDAGSSWVAPSWRNTLYNHSQTPNAPVSVLAQDLATSTFGASGYHASGVNVLIFDGSVRTLSPTVAPPVWKALATVTSGQPPTP